MQEILIEIAARLKDAPEAVASLTRRRAEASDALHRALDEAKRTEIAVAGEVAAAVEAGRPKYANEAARSAEVQRRLSANQAYQLVQAEVARLREELRSLDADLEMTKGRFQADNSLAFLAASLVHAGRAEDAEAALAAYRGTGVAQARAQAQESGRPQAEAQGQPALAEAPQQQAQAGGLEAGVFTVLEARATQSGAVRAYCQGEDGARVAVYGRNGAAAALSAFVGRQVRVKYRRGDRGLIAVDARPVA